MAGRQIPTAGDPMGLCEALWPDSHRTISIYPREVEIIEAMAYSDEVLVPAGNMLGKDYIAGFIALSMFLCPQLYFDADYVREVESWASDKNPFPGTCRIVTTSVKDDHLRVLWGEIGRFIQTCRYDLRRESGGPLVVNHRDIRKVVDGKLCEVSYLRGMVSERGEGMAGHHAAYTLQIIDEASGVDDVVYTQGDTWAKKKLIIGNPNPCNNFFLRGVRAGDLVVG